MIIYLSPDGNDAWSGQHADPIAGGTDGPLATLHEAQRRVREALTKGEQVEVRLRGGVYHLDATLVLGLEDSGMLDRPVVWRNYPGERPVLDGSMPVTEWRKLDEPLEGLPDAARGQVWVAELPDGIRPVTLYDDHGMLPRAAVDFATVNGEHTTRKSFGFAPGTLRAWPHLADVELFLAPKYPFTVNYLALASVDEAAGVATTTSPGTYDLITRKVSRIENVPEGLTEPGRWFFNGRLYLWPRDGQVPGGITVPVLTELIRIEGDFDAREWARHIVLHGLTFQRCDRLRWPEQRMAIQHDWDLYDAPTAAVRLRGAEHVTVRNCRFRESGGDGLRLDLHAVDNRIMCNEMTDLGGGGISLVGFGPGNRDENHHNAVTRNHIHHCCRLLWANAGIMVCQSGSNLIGNNLVTNLPYNGIVLVSGREAIFGPLQTDDGTNGGPGNIRKDELADSPADWFHRIGFLHCKHNIVEYNEVHDVMEILGDGNGIYISGTGVGNIIRRNYVHDLNGMGCHSAIRLDDVQWYTRITENVIWRINGGGITLKDINEIDNNIVVDCLKYGSMTARRSPSFGSMVLRNIFVQSGAELTTPGQYHPFYEGGGFGGKIEEPVIEDNLLFCYDAPDVAERSLSAMRGIGKDLRSLVADPCFVDREHGDFHLLPNSPALQLGFRPIERWGLLESVGPEE